MDIGTLTGSLVLEDNMSGILRQISGGVEEFGRRLHEGFDRVEKQLGDATPAWVAYAGAATTAGVAVVGAITGITAAITYLGVKGSEIQGVTDAFNDLSEQAGSTGDALLGGLMEGVKHTVDDFDLMKSTTRLLSSGMKLTAEDMRVLGATAREMGKATGTDAVNGLETLSQALLTGQSRLVRRYGIQVDLIQAEKDYAKELGVTRSELNQTEKIEAARIAILQGAKDKLDLLGESEVSFKEKLMQGTQAIDDWFDGLKLGIATSPHVMAALDSIGNALSEAFGTTSKSLLDNILYGVDLFADSVTQNGPLVIQELRDIKDEIVNLAYTIANSELVSGLKDFYDWLTKIENHPVFKFLMTGSTKGGSVGISDVIKSTNKELSMFQSPAQTARDFQAFENKLSKPFTDLYEDIMLGPVESKKIQDFSKDVDGLTSSLGGLIRQGTQLGALNIPAKITGPMSGADIVEGGGASAIVGGLSPQYERQARVSEDYEKKVRSLTESLRKGSEETRVFADAFRNLTPAQLQSANVQERLLPLLQKQYEATGQLSDAMRQEYDAALRTRAVQAEADSIRLKSAGVTIEVVEQLQREGLSLKEVATHYSVSEKNLATYVDKLRDSRDAMREFASGSAEINAQLDELTKAFEKAAESKFGAQMVQYSAAAQKANDVVLASTMTTLEAQENAIKKSAQQQLDDLTAPAEGMEAAYESTREAIIRGSNQQVAALHRDQQFITQFSRREAFDRLAVAQETLNYMKMHEEDFTKSAIKEAEKRVKAREKEYEQLMQDQTMGQKIIAGLTAGLSDSAKRIPQILSNAIINGADWKQTGMAIGSEVGGSIGEHIGAQLGKFGGPIGSAVGSLLGPVIGKIGDALHRSAGEDVVRRVGKDWGISITEEMGDTIAKQAKDMFHGSRQAAEIFNLDTLITAGGGLSPNNLDRMTHKLRDVFSMLETGMFDAGQAAHVLDENWSQFADLFGDGIISKGLREIVGLTQQAGVNSKAIGEFLEKQAQRARGGLEGILGQSLRFTQEGGKETDQFAGVVSQEQFDRLSRLATVSFQAAIAAGEPFIQVIKEMHDSFGRLNEAVDQFGFQQNAAFADVSAISAFFDKNQALAESIQGTNDMLVALANSNLMTQQTFSDLGAIAVENYNAMIEGGLTNQQALMAQQDTLQTLWELVNEGTFTVDDQTQALIDQAKEAGLVGEAHMDAQERATQAMEKAASAMEHVGDVLQQVFGIAGDEAETFADRTVAAAQRAAGAMARIAVPPNLQDFPIPEGVPAPIPMAEGGSGTAKGPTLFYSGGDEDFAFSGEGKSFGDIGSNEALLDELRGLRGDLQRLNRTQSRVVRDEVLTAPRPR